MVHHLSWKVSFSSITKTAFYHLRIIACLRPTLSTKDTETLIHVLTCLLLGYSMFKTLPLESSIKV